MIDCGCFCQPVGALVICDRGARLRSKQTIDFALIIALLLQGGLHICDHLIRWQIVIAVDRSVIRIIGICLIVAPSRVPIAGVPIIRSPTDHDDAVVTLSPPTLIVPLGRIVSKDRII